MEKRKVVIKCTYSLKDIEVEQISPRKSIHVGLFPIPVGIKGGGAIECKAYLIEQKGEEIVQKEIGTSKLDITLDEQKLYTTYEIEVPKGKEGLIGKILGKSLFIL